MASSIVLSDNGVTSGSAGIKSTGGSDGTLLLQTTTAGGTATTAVTVDNAQNVGVGVTPSAWGSGWKGFNVGSGSGIANTANTIYSSSNGYNDGTNWKYINSASSGMYYISGNTHAWHTAASGTAGNAITFTQAMTLDATGGLKTATYLWAAGVGNAGGVYLGSSGSANGLISQGSSGAATTTTYIGNAAITTVSDVRLKENIVDTQRNATEILSQLRVVDHTWNDPSDQCENNRNSRGVWMGLIAQEAQPIIPWLVNKPTADVDENGDPQYWHMDYGYSVPLLIKALQEQQAIIVGMREELDALKAKVGA